MLDECFIRQEYKCFPVQCTLYIYEVKCAPILLSLLLLFYCMSLPPVLLPLYIQVYISVFQSFTLSTLVRHLFDVENHRSEFAKRQGLYLLLQQEKCSTTKSRFTHIYFESIYSSLCHGNIDRQANDYKFVHLTPDKNLVAEKSLRGVN